MGQAHFAVVVQVTGQGQRDRASRGQGDNDRRKDSAGLSGHRQGGGAETRTTPIECSSGHHPLILRRRSRQRGRGLWKVNESYAMPMYAGRKIFSSAFFTVTTAWHRDRIRQYRTEAVSRSRRSPSAESELYPPSNPRTPGTACTARRVGIKRPSQRPERPGSFHLPSVFSVCPCVAFALEYQACRSRCRFPVQVGRLGWFTSPSVEREAVFPCPFGGD
jgi:hypothetical protein